MDVSVIVPYLEGGSILERALKSIRRSYDRAGVEGEIVTVNDRERRGVSDARNRGLERAKGEWIVFADSDDELEETFFEKMFLPYSKREELDIIAGGHRVLDPQGGELSGYRWPAGEMSGYSFIENRLLNRDAHVWAKLYRRSALKALTFDTGMTIGEDMLFLADAALDVGKRRGVMAVDEPVYRYYINPEGAMEKPYTESFLDELKCWRLLEDKLKAHAPALSAYALSALGTVRIRSALMVAVKTGRLCKIKGENTAAEYGFDEARRALGEAMRVRGAFAGLSARDKARALLLAGSPGIFKKALK